MARFLVEFIRVNPLVGFGLSQAQVISLLLIGVGGVLLARGRAWQVAEA
jgi:prolipoprotein diacylglyceryltransferase